MTNRELIDRLKQAHNIGFDLDIAVIFGLSKQQINDWTQEKRPIPIQMKFRILALTNFPNTMEFAAVFVDTKQLAEDLKKDRKAIERLHAMAKKADELLEHDEKQRTASKSTK